MGYEGPVDEDTSGGDYGADQGGDHRLVNLLKAVIK